MFKITSPMGPLWIVFLILWAPMSAHGEHFKTLELNPSQAIDLPTGSEATALAVDHFDRDGFPDLAIGYRLPDGSGAIAFLRGRGHLIYPNHAKYSKSPHGAHPFEWVSLQRTPIAVDWLTTGDFDAQGRADIAVASRDHTSVTWWPSTGDFAMGEIDQEVLPWSFDADATLVGAEPSRMLRARLNGDAVDDWIVLRPGALAPEFMVSVPNQTFTVTHAGDTDDGTCDSHCSLREAIQAANASAGFDAIEFAIGSGSVTIQLNSQLPTITETTHLDGTSQPGFVGEPLVELAGGADIDGLVIDGDDSCLRGFVINRFDGTGGVTVNGAGSIIEGNYIGTDTMGLAGLGNSSHGIYSNSNDNDIRIGGTTPEARNVIAGNIRSGIELRGGLFGGAGEGYVIQGNYIGVNKDGTTPLGNGVYGINSSKSYTTIGGTDPGASNVISGDRNFAQDVGIQSSGVGSVIQGNLIGTDASGTVALGNGTGIRGGDFLAGGPTPEAANTISGNTGSGIHVTSSTNATIQGNRIGVGIDGVTPLGNGTGVVLQSSGCLVGGTGDGEGNIIAHSSNFAMNSHNQRGNSVLGNSIHDSIGVIFNHLIQAHRPALTSAASNGSQTQIEGSFANGTAHGAHRIEFFSNPVCHSSGFGEGKVFLGATEITADATGAATFSVTLPVGVDVGHVLTATNTLPDGTTSSFSICEDVVILPGTLVPNLSIPIGVPALPASTVQVPVIFQSNGESIGALAFELDIDQTCLGFDPTDGNMDGLPDSVTLGEAAGLQVSVAYDAADTSGELEILVSQLPPLEAIADGTFLTLEFSTCSPAPGSSQSAALDFTATPAPSFGNLEGQSVPGEAANGSVNVLSGLPGDCNGDGIVDAGDLTACALEIFDGDGSLWVDAPGGTFAGNPVGCDANGDTTIDAGDVTCKGLLIFDNGPCGGVRRSNFVSPSLQLAGPFEVDESGRVRIRLEWASNGEAIAATTFSLDLGPGLTFVEGSFQPLVGTTHPDVTFDPGDTDGELDILLANLNSTHGWEDGALLEFDLESTEPTGSWIRFAGQPSVSFGTIRGDGILGVVDSAAVGIVPGPIFEDGFESGSLENWQAVGVSR